VSNPANCRPFVHCDVAAKMVVAEMAKNKYLTRPLVRPTIKLPFFLVAQYSLASFRYLITSWTFLVLYRQARQDVL
jgi:hypothetical protein